MNSGLRFSLFAAALTLCGGVAHAQQQFSSPAMNEQAQLQGLQVMQALAAQRGNSGMGPQGYGMDPMMMGMMGGMGGMGTEQMYKMMQQQNLQTTQAPQNPTITYTYDKAKMTGPFAGLDMPGRLFNNIPPRKER